MPLRIADKDKQITRTYSLTQELPNAISSTWTTVTPTAKIDEITTYQYATTVRSGSFASHEESIYINQTVSTDVFRAVTSIISSYESTKTITDISYNTSDNAKFTSYNKTVTYTAFDREETRIEDTGDNYNDSVRGIAMYDTESMSFGHTTFPAASASSKYSNGSTLLTVSVTSDFNCVLISKTGPQNQIIYFTNDSYDADPLYTYASDFPCSNDSITIDKDGDYFYITRNTYGVEASIYSGLSFNPYGTHTSQTNFVGNITAGLTRTTAAMLMAEPIPEMYRTSAAFFNLYHNAYPAFGIAYRQCCSSSMNASISSLVNDTYNAESTAFVSYAEQSVTGHASVQMTQVDYMYTNYIYGDSKSTWEDYIYRDSIMSNYSSALSNNQEYFYLHDTTSYEGYKYDSILRNAVPAEISVWSGESVTSSLTRVTGLSQSSSEDTTAYAGQSSFITTTATSANLSVSGTGVVNQDVRISYNDSRASTYGTAGSSSSVSTSGYTGKTSISVKTSTAISESLSASSSYKRGVYASGSTKYDTTYASNYSTTSSSSTNSSVTFATKSGSGLSTHSNTTSALPVVHLSNIDVTMFSSAVYTLSTSSVSYSDYRSTYRRSESSVITYNGSNNLYQAFQSQIAFDSAMSNTTTANSASASWTNSYTVSHCRQTSNGLGITATFGAAYGGVISNSSATWEKSAYTAAFGTTGTSSLKSLGFFKISDGNIGSLAAFIMGNGYYAYTNELTLDTITTSDVWPRITLRPYVTSKTSVSGVHGVSLLKSGNYIYGWMHNTTSYDWISFSAYYAASSLSTLSINDIELRRTNSNISIRSGSTQASTTHATELYNHPAPFAKSGNQAFTARTGYFGYGASTSCRFTFRQTSYNITASKVVSYTYSTISSLADSMTHYGSTKSSKTNTYSSTRQGNTTSTKTASTSTSVSSYTSASTTASSTNTYNVTTSTYIQSAALSLTSKLQSLGMAALENASYTITSSYGANTLPTGGEKYLYSAAYGTSSTSSTSNSSSTNTNGSCTIPNFSSTTALTRSDTYTTTTNGVTDSAWTSTAYVTTSSVYSTSTQMTTSSNFTGEGTYTMQSNFLTATYNTNIIYYPLSNSSSTIPFDEWYSTFSGSSSAVTYEQKSSIGGTASVEGEYIYYTETYPEYTTSTATFDTVTKSLTSSKFVTFTVESSTTFPDVEYVTDQVSESHYYATTTNVGTTTSLTGTYGFVYNPEYSIAENVTVTLTDVATHNTLI